VTSFPHVLFLAFASRSDPMQKAWTRFRDMFANDDPRDVANVSMSVSEPAKATANGYSGIWRLLAPNNREVGRSAFLYRSFASSRAHVVELQANVDAMAVTTFDGPRAGTHGWFVSIDDVAVMTCGRWYETVGTSVEAVTRALDTLRFAVVTDAPRRFDALGRTDVAASARKSSGSR
jgi:hypothetical protein